MFQKEQIFCHFSINPQIEESVCPTIGCFVEYIFELHKHERP